MEKPILIGPFRQLLPMTGLPLKGALSDEQLPIVKNAGILVSKGRILEIGSFHKMQSQDVKLYPIEGDQVCMPGLIDAHTHICFSGSRARDYALRNSGKT